MSRFYIVSASGPYLHKAWKEQIFLTEEEARQERDNANEAMKAVNIKDCYSVHEMMAQPRHEKSPMTYTCPKCSGHNIQIACTVWAWCVDGRGIGKPLDIPPTFDDSSGVRCMDCGHANVLRNLTSYPVRSEET